MPVCMTVPFTFMGRTSAEPTILRVGAKVVKKVIGCMGIGVLFDEKAYFIDINMSIHLDMSIHFRNFACRRWGHGGHHQWE